MKGEQVNLSLLSHGIVGIRGYRGRQWSWVNGLLAKRNDSPREAKSERAGGKVETRW